MMLCVFAKVKDSVFIPPIDAVIEKNDDGQNMGRLLAGALRQFWLADLITTDQVLLTVNNFIAYQAKQALLN